MVNPCVTGLTSLECTVIVGETPDTGNKLYSPTFMPNPTGHIDSIKKTQFSSPWQSGPTRTIRVPIALAGATLEYARQLDKGIEPHDTVDNVNIEVGVNTILSPDTSGSTLDAATLLNNLKAKYKKTKRKELLALTLADMEAILEMIEG